MLRAIHYLREQIRPPPRAPRRADQQSVREEAARHGLLPIHIQVLHCTSRGPAAAISPIAIAEYWHYPGTVSQSLAVLERKGLLTKARDAAHASV